MNKLENMTHKLVDKHVHVMLNPGIGIYAEISKNKGVSNCEPFQNRPSSLRGTTSAHWGWSG